MKRHREARAFAEDDEVGRSGDHDLRVAGLERGPVSLRREHDVLERSFLHTQHAPHAELRTVLAEERRGHGARVEDRRPLVLLEALGHLAAIAERAVHAHPDPARAPFLGEHPGALDERRLVPHVLPVPAVEVGDEHPFVVAGEGREGAFHVRQCTPHPRSRESRYDGMRVRGAFVGREAESAALDQALARARDGVAGLVLVGGEPGIGKTRLAEVFGERAEASGALVVWSRAWEAGAPAYWPIQQILRGLAESVEPRDLLDAVGDGADRLVAIAPELASKLGASESRGPHEPFALFEAVTHVLARATRAHPIVAVFDDLHAAEASSLTALRFVLRSAPASRLLLVGTYRTTASSMSAEASRAFSALTEQAQVVRLVGLSTDAIRRWLVDRVSPGEAASWADVLARATAGNPLFIDGVLRAALPSAGVAPRAETLALASDVRAAIAARLLALPEDARELLEALAVVGRPATLALLARVSGRSLEVVLAPAGRAVDEGLLAETGELGQYRFHHPLVGEVVYAALGVVRRASLHARVESALSELYGVEAPLHVSELARHCLAAVSLGAGARAVSLCHAAGRRAVELAAFAEAARHFADARAALAFVVDPPPPIPLTQILADLGEAQLASGQPLLARATFEALSESARQLGRGEDLGRAALGFARTFEFGVFEARRLALLEEAVSALEPDDSPTLARTLARLAQELWMVAGREEERATLAERAISMATRLDDGDALGFALNAWLQCVWGPEHRDARLARAEELRRVADRGGNPERQIEAHRWRINVAVEAGQIAKAEAAMRDYSALAESMRRPDYVANALVREAMIPQLRGDFVRAGELATRCHELQRLAGDAQADVVYDSRRILLAIATGRRDVVESLLPRMKEHVEARPRLLLYRAIYLRGLGFAGDPASVASEWERVWSNELEDLSRDMLLPATLALLVPPCISLSDTPRAERLFALLSPLASMHAAIGASHSLGSAARWAGLLAEHLGRRPEAAHLLALALEANEAMGAAYEREETLRDLCRVEPGRPSGAVSAAAVEAATLRSEGATWLVEHGGSTTRLKNNIGLVYLRILVERAGVEIHALDLVRAARGGPSGEGHSSELGPALDAKARAAYKARVDDLRDTIREAESFGDIARGERAREELERITKELARAFGLGGRARPQASVAERARISVTKALSRAVTLVSGELPLLGQHLGRSLRTGVFCAYDPDPSSRIHWNL